DHNPMFRDEIGTSAASSQQSYPSFQCPWKGAPMSRQRQCLALRSAVLGRYRACNVDFVRV
ncbi:MAG TPA: hypothetical protein VF077_03395, partial [Nitrospiraceae bacterium]